MAEPEHPQIYLLTPPAFKLAAFRDELARVLDKVAVACVRLDIASRDEATVAQAADTLRDVAHARDVAIVLSEHVGMVERLGLDGVHLKDGARSVRSARKALGPDAIVGAFCGTSRHDGLSAGEAGADYVAFGPMRATELGDGAAADYDLFAWWSEMIEVPIVAEGSLDLESVQKFRDATDFFAIGEELWSAEDPAAAISELNAIILGE
ncbi:MAG: thiamine phosphate synthase [Rhodobacteraceae bacterium]|nr:thiamine phosphate synthase [Paracoccaceae bacterium]